ncbi:hypothetical protein SFB2_196G0 [Candidatus Arthromitus sp. SFB-2]|nr:hypothetical protein SFB2_196G0 [Candidatus Arthromitus sp. SFB-2]
MSVPPTDDNATIPFSSRSIDFSFLSISFAFIFIKYDPWAVKWKLYFSRVAFTASRFLSVIFTDRTNGSSIAESPNECRYSIPVTYVNFSDPFPIGRPEIPNISLSIFNNYSFIIIIISIIT